MPAGGVIATAGAGVVFLVERMRCLDSRIWPLLVGSDLGRCLRTRSVVRLGQVVKQPASMASHQVEGTGLNAALCR